MSLYVMYKLSAPRNSVCHAFFALNFPSVTFWHARAYYCPKLIPFNAYLAVKLLLWLCIPLRRRGFETWAALVGLWDAPFLPSSFLEKTRPINMNQMWRT